MARRKTIIDPNIRVRVIKEHAGIKVGEVLVKPTAIAKRMIEQGYYEEYTPKSEGEQLPDKDENTDKE